VEDKLDMDARVVTSMGNAADGFAETAYSSHPLFRVRR